MGLLHIKKWEVDLRHLREVAGMTCPLLSFDSGDTGQ